MPKGKLKVKNSDVARLELACELEDVKIIEDESKEIGDMSIIQIAYKTISQVFAMGRYIDKIK